jgi:hypothetical protein
MSPSKIRGIGGQDMQVGGEVSQPHNISLSWSLQPCSPTKLLVFNVHGTLLDSSLLSQPNPNPTIRVTKKTGTRRFVFRPWMIEFLGRCLKNFKVAFWGIKSGAYMEEVLCEMLRVFDHLEDQFSRGQQKIVRTYKRAMRLQCGESL